MHLTKLTPSAPSLRQYNFKSNKIEDKKPKQKWFIDDDGKKFYFKDGKAFDENNKPFSGFHCETLSNGESY